MVRPVQAGRAGPRGDRRTSTRTSCSIVKLNIDENPETARAYRIMSIPTMSVFQGGQVVKNIVGAKPKAALLRDLEAYL